MKKIIVFLTMITLITNVFAQEDGDREVIQPKKNGEMSTLIGSSSSIGGYGAISMLYTQIDNKDAFVFGARGGAVLGHVFTFGFAGAGFINDFHYDPLVDDNVGLAGGYGGLFFEPIILPRYPVHISVPVLIGVGGIGYTTYNDHFHDNIYVDESDAFLVIEPGIELEFNVARFFRFSLGGYYRYTSDINLINTPKNVLTGFSGGVNFKFGVF